MQDNRLHQRVTKSLQMVLVYQGQEHEALSKDLSLGGVFIIMDDPPPVNAKVVLRVLLPDLKEPSSIASTVRWHGHDGAGLRFDSLRAIEAWALNRLLNDV